MRFFRLTLLLCGISASMFAQTKVSLSDLQGNWDQYIGQRVQIIDPLVVCGVFYDSLILARERLYVPEERAQGLQYGDSTTYWEWVRYNKQQQLVLHAKLSPWKIMVGSTIRSLKAQVVAPGQLLTGAEPSFANNTPKPRKPNRKGATLSVCAANIQNFFYHIGGYASAKNREQQDMQTRKVALGLKYLNADIYALCEIEKGSTAPKHLCKALNAITKTGRYAYVDTHIQDGDTISVGFIYRTDRVRPYGETLFSYDNPHNIYYCRFMTHGFEELRTGERFILSVNHPRSKRGPAERSNRLRMENIERLLNTVSLAQKQTLLNDSDVLLVGDYNSYTWEQPIRHIVENGYADQLLRFDSTGYSYVYKGESGYLDRVFASPSMATQITTVHPVHMNADCFYSWGYKQGRNKTMFRYSDHDPIWIGIKLSSHK